MMSATGLDVLDKSLQTTNIWLKEIMQSEAVGPDRQVAWRVLGAVLHTLRDRLSVEQVAHLGAELPIVVRGLYYDQWHPAGKPERERRAEEFVARVNSGLHDIRPVNPAEATRTVFRVMNRHISRGQVDKIRQSLPEDIRRLWADPGNEPPAREAAELTSELEKTGAA
jgi:uncharacterized protein (DUF2267 family)